MMNLSGKRLELIYMSTCYSLMYFLLPILAHSCSPYNFSCASVTFEIKYPFYTSTSPCRGLHLVQCANFVSVIKLHNQEFSYPLSNISYTDKSLEIIDLKLSSYFQGYNCVFLYDFKSPITEFNASNVTNHLSSTQGFFNCEPNRYDFSHDVFKELYNLSFCEDYSLDYGARSDDGFPSYCTTSRNMWFVWRLAFDKGDGGAVSLLSAGFSRKWASFLDCFNCRTVAGNCSSHCRGVNPREGGSHNYRWVAAGKSEAKRKFKIIGVSVGLASFLIGSFLLILWFRWRKSSYGLFYWRKNAKHAQTIEAFLEKYQYLATKRYAYSDIKKITKSFSEKLGQGGYGSVYKGKMFDGNPVAVKVLNETKSDGEDFINEIAAIGNTSHVNIVTLRGFCVDGSKRALLYDFMPNGSLEKYICSKKPIGEASLGWEKLYEVAIGIARGLEYLHRGCNTRIVHFDIKPHNILLDQDFCPKISDFGMSKLCPPKQSIVSMCGARGTIGYIAPEVFSRTFGVVSSKSDVYSYGMMILEMFGAKNSTNARLMESSTSEAYFPQSIYQHINNGDYLKEFGVTDETEEIAKKMMIVGFWCIQTMPEDRPSMTRVVDMLEGSMDELSIPAKPFLASPLDLIADSHAESLLEI